MNGRHDNGGHRHCGAQSVLDFQILEVRTLDALDVGKVTAGEAGLQVERNGRSLRQLRRARIAASLREVV